MDLTHDSNDDIDTYMDLTDAAAPSGGSEPKIAEQTIEGSDPDAQGFPGLAPQPADNGDASSSTNQAKSETKSAMNDRDKVTEGTDSSSRLLSSMPIYLSQSLASTSKLQIFQYPTYAGGRSLPIPQSARERGLQPSMRIRPKANRIEVELPLDLRPMVYNTEKGEIYAEGADAAAAASRETRDEPEVKVKREFGEAEPFDRAGRQSSGRIRRLEKTRLESSLMPPQTQYMIGVIRDNALHLTAVDSMHQMRPSMHYLDAKDALKRQDERRKAGDDEDEDLDEEGEQPAKKSESSNTKRKAQSINVTLRGESAGNRGGGSSTPVGGIRSGPAVGDSRDHLMRADREAESERWVNLNWKDETSAEAAKIRNSQMFASSKTLLKCKTRPKDFLESIDDVL
jgi:DNA-directed RNA polymerase-3 subunit RPC5